jgi:hypothetical protein
MIGIIFEGYVEKKILCRHVRVATFLPCSEFITVDSLEHLGALSAKYWALKLKP